MTPGRSPLFTRRRVLTGLGVGLVAVGVSETGAFESAEAPRTSTIQVVGDEKAILKLEGFKENPDSVYKEPHEVKVTNNTGVELSGDPENTVSSDNGKLEFQQGSNGPESTLTLSELSDGESETFEIVTASGYTGDVSDDVTLSYAQQDEISIEVTRNITVSSNPPGGLVYAMNGDVRVYDAVEDEELDPPNSTNANIIGPSTADFIPDSDNDNDADIAFAPSEDGSVDGMYSTEIDATSENTIESGSPSDHNIWYKNARFTLAKWPGIDGTNDTDVEPNEYVILYASKSEDIYAMDADSNTEKIVSPDKGAAGVAGVADIDGDSEKEMMFLDSSQGLRYLNQDEDNSTSNMGVQVGSDSSFGFGPPASFEKVENLSNVQVPFIDGSSVPSLVDSDGTKTTLTGNAKSAACAPFDIDDDGKLEFVFINSNGYIAYVDDVGSDNETVEKLKIGGDNGYTREPDVSTGLNSGTRTN